jgi:hypothetical protein
MELQSLAFTLAQTCLDCQIKVLDAHRWALSKASSPQDPHLKAGDTFLDCQKKCWTVAEASLGRETLSADPCLSCARACEDCADEAERLDGVRLKDCVVACRLTAQACREMISALGQRGTAP